MTTEQAMKKLKSMTLTNKVYVGNKVLVDGKDTKVRFTDGDMAKVKRVFKTQRTWIPSFKEKNYMVMPGRTDHYRNVTLKQEVSKKTGTAKSTSAGTKRCTGLSEGRKNWCIEKRKRQSIRHFRHVKGI